ncbi:MAG: gamma-glutamyltransferase [Bdellovibrionales bacterium]|nr:gamma-glutamyltransferase [Bdellovibrionales bacterium]
MKTLFIFIFFLTVNNPVYAIPTSGHKIMIAGPSAHAVTTLQDISDAGGNVVDAAVAVALTLAVTTPYYAALGGGGFAMIRMDNKVETLDFREVAPKDIEKISFTKNPEGTGNTRKGGRFIGVPGLPAGLKALHQKYGKLPWKRLFVSCLRLAQEGFRVSGEWVHNTQTEYKTFNEAGRKYFLKTDKSHYQPGQLLKQIALAQALLEFRNKGVDGFYQGAVARDLIKSVLNNDGTLTAQDLKDYKVKWREPLTTNFFGYKIYLMPPPSSGGVILKTALGLTEKLNLPKYKLLSVDELHLMSEILSHSFRGRMLLGDPDFNKIPISYLLSTNYLNELFGHIHLEKSSLIPPIKDTTVEGQETTHFSIADSEGNSVAFTVTLNGRYGSGIVSERFGIALNNEMDDFTFSDSKENKLSLSQGSNNRPQSGKRPLSSMSPTIVEKDNKLVLSLGAPGGTQIPSAVYQVLYRHLINLLNIDEAIQAPRLHHQYNPNKINLDEHRFSPEITNALIQKGHELNYKFFARTYAVKLRTDGTLEAAFDSRGEGAAGGY